MDLMKENFGAMFATVFYTFGDEKLSKKNDSMLI